MSHNDIASALGISRATLERHFRDELTRGACARRARIVEALYKAAVEGNATAARVFLNLTREPSGRLGKKELADRDAVDCEEGTDWQDLLKSDSVN